MMTVRARIFGGLAALTATMLTLPARASDITILNVASAGGYQFTNFDGPNVGSGSTTIDGISNNGTVVGFTTTANGTFNNFTDNPLQSPSATALSLNSQFAMANGINSAGVVVGSDGNNNAFSLTGSTETSFAPTGSAAAQAFGINDSGVIVGNYTTNQDTEPGFVLKNGVYTTINAPLGPNTVFAQGINNNGLVVGYFVGNDGQDHGFMFNANSAVNHVGTGSAIADPIIPTVAGEPGATFVFSQILGINDQGIAVGYYGDSTASQHGFIYNTNTGQYTFLDDPNEGFSNGVEVTQITGINNSDEITGFYTDASGVSHGFVATVAGVPEPSSVILLGAGLAAVMGYARRRQKRDAVA
jgi:probable HAF family extracellular repeat protein